MIADAHPISRLPALSLQRLAAERASHVLLLADWTSPRRQYQKGVLAVHGFFGKRLWSKS
jgi:hypothetical protein